MPRFLSIFSILLFLCPVVLLGQPDSLTMLRPVTLEQLQREQDAALSPHSRIYAQARKNQDWQSALTAALYLLDEQPGNTFLEDSIAGFYARTGNYTACKAWCNQLLAARPDSPYLHILLAEILAAEGDARAALTHYESLADLTANPYFIYQVAALQLQLERYGECRTTAGRLTATEKLEDKIRITNGDKHDIVSITAAAYNLLGAMERKLGNEKEARMAFRKALELEPAFSLAKQNLQARPISETPERGGGGN